jgi:hypothetical protein
VLLTWTNFKQQHAEENDRKKNLQMTRLILLTVGLILLSLIGYAESDTLRHKERMDRIVRKIEKQKSLLLNYNLTGKNRRLANKLSKSSSNSELIRLTKNKNPTVFCIAYLILAKRKDPFVESFYQNYLRMSEQEFINWDEQINRINREHKSDVVMLYGKVNFVDDVRNREKFIDQIW